MLGHSNPVTTAKAYLPWVKELEQSTIAEGRVALKKGSPYKQDWARQTEERVSIYSQWAGIR